MIAFMFNAVLVLIGLFIVVLISSLMLWVIVKLLRGLFPGKFAPSRKREGDEV